MQFYFSMKRLLFLLLFSSLNLFAQTVSKDAQWLAPASKPKMFGLQDNKGGIAVKAQFDYLTACDGTGWIAYLGGKYGVINNQGNWIIKPNFETIVQFVNGKAVAGKRIPRKSLQEHEYDTYAENEYDSVTYFGVIDASGIWVIDPQYDFLRLCDDGSVQYTGSNGNFGFLNPDGTLMLRAQYQYASRMTNGVAIIAEPKKVESTIYNYSDRYHLKAGNYFIIDRTGKKINSEPYELIREFSEGRAAFNKGGIWKYDRYSGGVNLIGGKWGFLDAEGKEIVEGNYDYVYDYKNGKAKVRTATRIIWIDKDGKESLQPSANSQKEFTIYCEPGFYGYVDLKGNWGIEPQYFSAQEFSEGLAAAMALRASDNDCNNGVNDVSDEIENSRSQYSKPLSYLLSLGNNYQDDYELNQKQDVDSIYLADSIAALLKRRLYGYIDVTGNMVLPAKYEVALPFHNGRAYVCFRGNWGVIDKKGNWIFAPILECPDELTYLLPNYGYVEGSYPYVDSEESSSNPSDYNETENQKMSNPIFSFYDGVGIILKYNKYGFIDTTGKIIVPPIYDEAIPFSNGFAAVRHGKFWGFIDKTGKEIIPLQYESACSFSKEGLACVGAAPDRSGVSIADEQSMQYESGYNVYYGYIDKKGNWAIKPQFTKAGSFSDGLAAVSTNYGKLGYIDKTGKFIIPPKYDYANDFKYGFALVKINMLEAVYIDPSGKVSKIYSTEKVPFDKSFPLTKKQGINLRYGFVNEKGEEIIGYQFSEAGDFAKVK